MNRKFHPLEENRDPDSRVVSLAKSLMDRADIILNLHQGNGFYSPIWVDNTRNPVRWGQCNVIDVPIFNLPDGRSLDLERFARQVAQKINSRITDKRYYFQVNNTNTSSEKSSHREQRRSLTYYALTRKHKMAFGIEATKNCSLPQAVSYLTMAVNAMLDKAGIMTEAFPSVSPAVIEDELKRGEEFSGLRVKINGLEKLIPPRGEILLAPGDRLQVLSVEAKHTRGWYPSLLGFHTYNGIGKEFSIRQRDQLILHKNGKRVAVFNISDQKRIFLLAGKCPQTPLWAGSRGIKNEISFRETPALCRPAPACGRQGGLRKINYGSVSVMKMRGRRSPGERLIGGRIGVHTLPKRNLSLERSHVDLNG